MKVEHLGDGAYVTVNRDFVGQVIFTADHHDEYQASGVVHMQVDALRRALELYNSDAVNALHLPTERRR